MNAIPWAEVDARTKMTGVSIYDFCWVCGEPLGPDKLHVLIEAMRFMRHVYCCRKHRYVAVQVGGQTVIQTRSDLEIESLSHAFKDGRLAPGWE